MFYFLVVVSHQQKIKYRVRTIFTVHNHHQSIDQKKIEPIQLWWMKKKKNIKCALCIDWIECSAQIRSFDAVSPSIGWVSDHIIMMPVSFVFHPINNSKIYASNYASNFIRMMNAIVKPICMHLMCNRFKINRLLRYAVCIPIAPQITVCSRDMHTLHRHTHIIASRIWGNLWWSVGIDFIGQIGSFLFGCAAVPATKSVEWKIK